MMLTGHEINEQQGHISEANVLLMQLETNIDAIEEFVRLGKLAKQDNYFESGTLYQKC